MTKYKVIKIKNYIIFQINLYEIRIIMKVKKKILTKFKKMN